MRDQQIAALELLQELLEKLDALEIEVVRRLVQQEQIDLRQQHAREHGPVLLAAAELVDRTRPLVLVVEADSGQHALDQRVERVAVRVLVVVLQLGVLLEELRVLGLALRRVREIVLDRAHAAIHPQHVRERRLDEIEERHPSLGVEMLADVADGHAGGADDLPVIGLFLLEEETEERRLPGAVAADQADVLAGVVLPGHALEDVVRAVAFFYVIEAVEHRGRRQRSMRSGKSASAACSSRYRAPAHRGASS